MYNSFDFYAPTRIVFGRDAETRTGELLKEYGCQKALILYGGKRTEESGLLDKITATLDGMAIGHTRLGGVVPNPHLSTVYRAIELGRREGVDFVLAVGGGSVIDTAKATAYGLAEERDVWELYEHTRKAKRCLPVGAVLTIAAAGSEMSNGSVITNEKTAEKRAYDDDLARPKFAIMDPELTMTLSDYQTQSGCVDMMMHTMERYFTRGGNLEITDSMAEALMRTVMKNALILRDDPQNSDARSEVMWAGSLAHNGLTGCGNAGGDFASHILEHELGGMFDVTHGAGLAAIWPSWARYVYRECLPRFVRFATEVMGVKADGADEDIAVRGIEAMEKFYHDIHMPINLRELGVFPNEEQIQEMARRASAACAGQIGSAKVLTQTDMRAIYRMAI